MPDFPTHFDIVFHILGEQNIPNYMGIKQFQATEHVFICTEETRANARQLSQAVRTGANIADPIIIPPYSIPNALASLEEAKTRWPNLDTKSTAFNCTGGTKQMYDAVRQFCQSLNGFPFYLETRHSKLHALNGNFPPRRILPSFDSVDEFISLTPQVVRTHVAWEDRHESRVPLTNYLWEQRLNLGALYGEISRGNYQPAQPFGLKNQNFTVTLDNTGVGSVYIYKQRFDLTDAEDLALYLTGGWLEEYCYQKIRESKTYAQVKDMKMNVSIRPAVNAVGPQRGVQEFDGDTQEFDLALTDGHTLTIVECKARKVVLQSDFQKLDNNTLTYGGSHGRGILACAQLQDEASGIPERTKNSRRIAGFFGEGLQNQLAPCVLTIRPGKLVV